MGLLDLVSATALNEYLNDEVAAGWSEANPGIEGLRALITLIEVDKIDLLDKRRLIAMDPVR